MNLYEDVDIVSFIRLSRLRWIGHVSRMDKERKVYKIFCNQPQGTQVKGRPKNRWMVHCQTFNAKLGTGRSRRDRGIWRRSIMEAKACIGL
jgi:hypothetical protein